MNPNPLLFVKTGKKNQIKIKVSFNTNRERDKNQAVNVNVVVIGERKNGEQQNRIQNSIDETLKSINLINVSRRRKKKKCNRKLTTNF